MSAPKNNLSKAELLFQKHFNKGMKNATFSNFRKSHGILLSCITAAIEEAMGDEVNCVICKKQISSKSGNDPWPVKNEGVCCDYCNITKVVPERFNLAKIENETL